METEGMHEQVAAYALDALSEPDRREFEQHLAQCTICKEELESLRAAASSLAYAVDPVEPPPELRSRLLDEIRAEPGVVIPFRRRALLPAAAALAVAACAAVVVLALWTSSLSGSLDRERSARKAETQALTLIASPGAHRVELSGAPGELIVNDRREAALVVLRLPDAPSGKTYEAWVIGSGRTEPAGLFPGGESSILALDRQVPVGSHVAVTLEPRHGSKQPTRAPILESETA